MTKSYSEDLRKRVVKARLSGESVEDVAARFGVGRDCVYRWVALHKATGTLKPRQRGGYRPPKIVDLEKFRRFAEVHRSSLLIEMADAWGGGVSAMCISRTLKRIGWSRKKNSGLPRTRRGKEASIS
jgi:transposase